MLFGFVPCKFAFCKADLRFRFTCIKLQLRHLFFSIAMRLQINFNKVNVLQKR